jgi:hypothetical protein
MKTRRGWVQGYNAQLVVTPQQIILASEVTTEANDVRQLQPMLDRAQAMVEILLGGGCGRLSRDSLRVVPQRMFDDGSLWCSSHHLSNPSPGRLSAP